MGRKIKIDLGDGRKYTLRFTKRSITALEDGGVKLEELEEPSLKVIWAVFDAAFKAEHPDITKDEIDEVFECVGDRMELFKELIEMIAEQANAMFDEPKPKKGETKNPNWTVSK